MHRIVLTFSAMWLFDVIKKVMSSTVPDKNGSQSWAKPAKPRSLWPSEQNVQVLSYSPYSPNLAPYFGGSPSPKKSWLGGNFPAFRIRDLAKAVHLELRALSPSVYHNAFESWCRQLKTVCVRSGGEHFKGMWMLQVNLTVISCSNGPRASLTE